MFVLADLFNILERGNASYDRVDDLFKERSHDFGSQDAITTPAHGDIRYQINKFSYPNDQQVALEPGAFYLY